MLGKWRDQSTGPGPEPELQQLALCLSDHRELPITERILSGRRRQPRHQKSKTGYEPSLRMASGALDAQYENFGFANPKRFINPYRTSAPEVCHIQPGAFGWDWKSGKMQKQNPCPLILTMTEIATDCLFGWVLSVHWGETLLCWSLKGEISENEQLLWVYHGEVAQKPSQEIYERGRHFHYKNVGG